MSPAKHKTAYSPHNKVWSGRLRGNASQHTHSEDQQNTIYTRCLTYTIYLKALPETAFYNIQNRRTKLFFRFHYTRSHVFYIYVYIEPIHIW